MKPRINWRRVWAKYKDWCEWMNFTVSNTMEYQFDEIQRLVNAELRNARKEKPCRAAKK